MPAQAHRVTVSDFARMKADGRKITMLTAYDFTLAELLDASGIDSILVGDSLSMVVQGHETTLPVTLEQMIYHAEMVGRAVRRALVIVDLPFPHFQLGTVRAIESAGRILKESRCQAVKIEGGAEHAGTLRDLVAAGIPVMAHVGLRPQSVHVSGYKVQRDEARLLEDAQAAEAAGAFAIVLECVPESLAARVTQSLRIPTIGIGAGPHCDGQVLVVNDLLGLTPDPLPKFVKRYAQLREIVTQASQQYQAEVREGQFPGPGQTYH